jgi:Retrotransposon gag protein/Zinc knuckle
MVDPLVELASLRAQVAQLNAFAAQQQQQQQQQHNVAAAGSSAPPRIDLPKIRQPSTFAGAMGFAVDDWIGEMEQQFAYYGAKFATDVIKIQYAVAFFSGPAMHWWDHETDRVGLDWAGFVRRLHGRFRPVQAAMLARQRIGKLSQRNGQTVNQYTSLFQTTMTPIVDMGDADQVHHYVNGLIPYVAGKVWERHPTTLKEAIDFAVSVEAMGQYGRAALSSANHGRSTFSSSGSAPMDTSLHNLEQQSFDGEHYGSEASNGTLAGNAPAATGSDSLHSAIIAKMEMMESRLNAMFAKQGNNYGNRDRRPPSSANTQVSGLKPGEVEKLRSEGRCFRCKQKGHMKFDCPQRPKNE